MLKSTSAPLIEQSNPQTQWPSNGEIDAPSFVQAILQAKTAYQHDEWTEAERICQLILTNDPDNFEALNLLAIVYAQTHRSEKAVDLLSKAIAVNPGDARAHSNRGYVLQNLLRYEDALECYERALIIVPNDTDTLFRLSCILGSLKRFEEALNVCDKVLKISPNAVEILNNRGNALGALNRPLEALECFALALRIKPDYAEAMNNRGAVLRKTKQFTEALKSHRDALRIQPLFHEAIYNCGVVLTDLKRPTEAIAAFEHALTHAPDYVDTHWNLSLCHLQLGNYLQGWKGYEWRWKQAQLAKDKRDFPHPLWLGATSLTDKTILLHSEAGLGDTLQFCRYARQVAALGATVVLETQAPLLPILEDLDGTERVLGKGEPLPSFDYHCPLMSLPLAFNTTLDTIPTDIPYLHSDPARVTSWQLKLGTKKKPRAGLVWSGNANHKNDHNRSIALSELLPLLDTKFEWVSLQKLQRL